MMFPGACGTGMGGEPAIGLAKRQTSSGNHGNVWGEVMLWWSKECLCHNITWVEQISIRSVLHLNQTSVAPLSVYVSCPPLRRPPATRHNAPPSARQHSSAGLSHSASPPRSLPSQTFSRSNLCILLGKRQRGRKLAVLGHSSKAGRGGQLVGPQTACDPFSFRASVTQDRRSWGWWWERALPVCCTSSEYIFCPASVGW